MTDTHPPEFYDDDNDPDDPEAIDEDLFAEQAALFADTEEDES